MISEYHRLFLPVSVRYWNQWGCSNFSRSTYACYVKKTSSRTKSRSFIWSQAPFAGSKSQQKRPRNLLSCLLCSIVRLTWQDRKCNHVLPLLSCLLCPIISLAWPNGKCSHILLIWRLCETSMVCDSVGSLLVVLSNVRHNPLRVDANGELLYASAEIACIKGFRITGYKCLNVHIWQIQR